MTRQDVDIADDFLVDFVDVVDVVVDANVVDDVDVDIDHVPPALGERDCGSGQERDLELPCRGGRQQNGG